MAAMARNNDGPLRFLEQTYPNSPRDLTMAFIGGGTLVACTTILS
jgi:cobalt/nickel transport system permease protein